MSVCARPGQRVQACPGCLFCIALARLSHAPLLTAVLPPPLLLLLMLTPLLPCPRPRCCITPSSLQSGSSWPLHHGRAPPRSQYEVVGASDDGDLGDSEHSRLVGGAGRGSSDNEGRSAYGAPGNGYLQQPQLQRDGGGGGGGPGGGPAGSSGAADAGGAQAPGAAPFGGAYVGGQAGGGGGACEAAGRPATGAAASAGPSREEQPPTVISIGGSLTEQGGPPAPGPAPQRSARARLLSSAVSAALSAGARIASGLGQVCTVIL